jgi:replication initiation protein RepC
MSDTFPPASPPASVPEASVAPVRRAPTGRRVLTPAKLAALDYPPPLQGGPTRGEILSAFRRALPALGIVQLRPLIDLLMSRSLTQDWTGRHRPMVWTSNDWLCARLDIREGRLKELIGLAFEHQLIAMREAGNGHRRGEREKGEGGCIISAFGFDLSPLAARYAEFLKLAADFEHQETTARRLRAELSGLRREVLTLADLGEMTASDVADWKGVAFRARQIAGQGRNQKDNDTLRLLVRQITEIRGATRALLEPASLTETSESDPWGSPERPLITTTNQPIKLKEDAGADEKTRPNGSSAQPRVEPADPLRGFLVTPALILKVAPAFRDLVVTAKPSPRDVIDAAWHVCRHLSISQSTWGDACVALGRWEATAAVAAIAGRHAAGEVRSPNGLLRRMVQLYEAGDLHLDRTLRGLMMRVAQPTDQPSTTSGIFRTHSQAAHSS